MKNHHFGKKNGTITVRVMCAVLFCLFSFCWLYWFQADVLAVAQHVLSNGMTHYHRFVGAVLITALLLLLQQLVGIVTRQYRRAHALTFLPSMLILMVISDVNTDIDRHFSMGGWWIAIPIILLIWGVALWLARQLSSVDADSDSAGLFSRRMWINALTLCVMMLAVALVGNTNAVFHFRAHAEVALCSGDYDEALRVGQRSDETDASLTMLRIYALSKKNQLGEQLFSYPVSGSSADMLPAAKSGSRLVLLPTDSLWRHLGSRPSATMNAGRFLQALKQDTLATPAVAHYVLCSHLIDRDIDAFVSDLQHYYTLTDSVCNALPRHYREALTLYTHLRSMPSVAYRNAVMDEDWANLQELERTYQQPSERMGAVANKYRGSYWFYYFYTAAK
jgi:hypothetical protein